MTVQIPSQFFYEFLETHYQEIIKSSLKQAIGDGVKLIYSVVMNEQTELLNDNNKPLLFPSKPGTVVIDANFDSHLNDRYTFESFVEGGNNQFARAASFAVAGFITTGAMFIMSLIPGLVNLITMTTTLGVLVIGAFWLFFSKRGR